MSVCYKNGRLKITEILFEYTNPIFKKYFGENFQETVQAQKQTQQEKLFETAFEVIKQLPSMWINASAKYDISNKEFIDFHNKLEEDAVFTKIFEANQYERFCDFFDVLNNQIKNIVSGDQSLTPMMQVVANNIGYKRSETRENIEGFVENNDKSEDLNAGRYAWHLHALDTLRYLSKSSDIDISVLKTSLNKIKVKTSDGFSRRSDKEDKNYDAYRALLTSNPVLIALSKAIDNDSNYHNLSFDQNITAIEDLIVIQRQMKILLEKDKEEKDWREKIEWDFSLSKTQKHVRYARGYLTETFQKAVNVFGLYTPEQKEDMRNEAFLETLNNKISQRLDESINQILNIENPLKKMKKLYWFYNAEKESFSADRRLKQDNAFLIFIPKTCSIK